LWDCGGQEAFLDHYVSTQKDQIFSNVAILIYVFDATTASSSSEWEKDVQYFEECIEALRGNESSNGAGVWVLVNKMDLVGQGPEGSKEREEGRRQILKEKKEELEIRAREIAVSVEGRDTRPIRVYGTSIWDESLYKVCVSCIFRAVRRSPYRLR
jgi:Ras-related GTP-binding protein A/B